MSTISFQVCLQERSISWFSANCWRLDSSHLYWVGTRYQPFVRLTSDFYRLISQVVRMFANSPVDRGSIPGRAIPKTQKWYLMPPCLTLSIIRYVSRVKRSKPEKEIATSPTLRCSSYWKGNLRVALSYGRQLTLPAIFTSFIFCTDI